MAYTVKSSERLRPSAADTETKALLYLMNFRDDSDEIFFFVVDFFNDLTGMNKMGDKLWDLQSKGDKQPSPYIIGTELVTLYKNFVSEFEFAYYIIFLGGVSSSLRIDDTKIDQFLKKVYFVIDDQSKSEYVKKIIKLNPTIIPSEDTLVAIFNEIRDAQSGKKNASVVEGVTLVAPDEALNYGRHLTTTEIRLLVLNRILNQDVIGAKVPHSFIDIYVQFPEEKRKNLLEDCQLDLSRALFNTNCQEDFWKLFENIYQTILENPTDKVEELYRKLDKLIIGRCLDFDVLSLKYFAIIIVSSQPL